MKLKTIFLSLIYQLLYTIIIFLLFLVYFSHVGEHTEKLRISLMTMQKKRFHTNISYNLITPVHQWSLSLLLSTRNFIKQPFDNSFPSSSNLHAWCIYQFQLSTIDTTCNLHIVHSQKNCENLISNSFLGVLFNKSKHFGESLLRLLKKKFEFI